MSEFDDIEALLTQHFRSMRIRVQNAEAACERAEASLSSAIKRAEKFEAIADERQEDVDRLNRNVDTISLRYRDAMARADSAEHSLRSAKIEIDEQRKVINELRGSVHDQERVAVKSDEAARKAAADSDKIRAKSDQLKNELNDIAALLRKNEVAMRRSSELGTFTRKIAGGVLVEDAAKQEAVKLVKALGLK